MKKLALAMVSASVAVFGFGLVASAAGYDPAISANPASPAAGGAYTLTYANCFVGDTITFTQADSTPTSVQDECEPVGGETLSSVIGLVAQSGSELGVAVGQFTTAPTKSGVYYGTGVGVRSPSLPLQFEIAVNAPVDPEDPDTSPTPTPTPDTGATLPDTGTNGISTTTGLAVGLLAVGLGLFAVAQFRRRQDPSII